ncbi:AEC family transporter [Lactobacillus taiwanensis]|nr:AEC family transporter [Lactobacillus taiwanensis]MCR1903612.1 AEC family transporter [Lactobacillus taiwanensis]
MALILPTKQVVIMFILMIIGWVCYQVKFLHGQTVKDLTKILLYVISLCLIVNSFRQSFSKIRLLQFGLVFSLIASLFVFKIIISRTIFNEKWVKNHQKRTVLQYAGTSTNAGFMGVPLVQAILGTKESFLQLLICLFITFSCGRMGLGCSHKRKSHLEKFFSKP